MKTIRFFAGLVIMAIPMWIGCNIAPELSKEEKQLLKEPATPYSKASSFSQAISNLGIMIETYGFPPLTLQGKNIVNKTACQQNLPFDITDMLKTAANNIGGRVKYVVYDPEYEKYKKGQVFEVYGYDFKGMPIPRGSIPQVVIDGSITECDKNLDTKSSNITAYGMFGGGKSEADVDGSISKTLTYSRLAIDLHVMDYKTNELIPKKQTSMAINVWNLEKSRDLGFRIYGSGIGIDGQRRITQGEHNAVRSLVELSILQLVGKYLEIPYWRCLPDGKEDPEVINMMRESFRQGTPAQAIKTIQLLLQKYGFQVTATGTADQQTLAAIREFRRKLGRQPSDEINENLYVDLLVSMPMSFAGGRPIAQVQSVPTKPSAQTSGEKTKYSQSQSYPSVSDPQKEAQSLSLNVNFVYRSGGTGNLKKLTQGSILSSGDFYKVVIKPNMNCYVYVFQADSSGQFFQLFPMDEFKGANIVNPLNKDRTYILPAEDKAFVLDQQIGTERIYLIVSLEKNAELERLYSELKANRGSRQAYSVNDKLRQYFMNKRGVKGVASEQSLQVAWKETGNIFSIMGQKLENMSPDAAYILEFNHK